jgi:hypothetical protein
MVAFAIASTIWFASGDSSTPQVAGRRIGPNGTGVTAVLPPGWRGDIAPGALDQIMFVQRDPTRGPDEALVDECEPGYPQRLTIRMTEGLGRGPTPPPVARPKAFTARTGHIDPDDGADTCYVHGQYVAFKDHGRTLAVEVAIGKDVTDKQLQDAYSILDSVHVSPVKDA